ncbi:hypothetical protein AF331_12140 [Rossellomorea marisflavi]|uniref:Uncharacterized protein n=1 Tax=Rossellomorea marisflavi TaxID=189381 RepID=A0A0M0G4J9_9BACI|nr:hypothetical protein AF331_12140 [Rossellomorea marisflavi]
MGMKAQHQVIFCAIHSSSIKKFLLLDCLAGTGFYYMGKVMSSSVYVGIASSVICTEGIKRLLRKR